MASVMNFYTDDSPGIKMSPVSFLGSVHFYFFCLTTMIALCSRRKKKLDLVGFSLSLTPRSPLEKQLQINSLSLLSS